MDIIINSLRNATPFLKAFIECSDEIRAIIVDMLDIVHDPTSTKDEIDAALDTIVEAMFPSK